MRYKLAGLCLSSLRWRHPSSVKARRANRRWRHPSSVKTRRAKNRRIMVTIQATYFQYKLSISLLIRVSSVNRMSHLAWRAWLGDRRTMVPMQAAWNYFSGDGCCWFRRCLCLHQLCDTLFREVCARLCESPAASGTNVGDVTPGTPELMVSLSY